MLSRGAGLLPAWGGWAGRSRPGSQWRAARAGAAKRLCLRGDARTPRAEGTTPQVPAHRDAPPLGTKCVLCRPCSLPSRDSVHCSICGGERTEGPTGAGSSSKQIPACHADAGDSADMAAYTDILGSPLLIGCIPVANFAPPSRHPQHLHTNTHEQAQLLLRMLYSDGQFLYYVSESTK